MLLRDGVEGKGRKEWVSCLKLGKWEKKRAVKSVILEKKCILDLR